MSLDIPTLSTLSTTDVAARLALIQAAVAELAPSYERRRGVLHDVVLSLHATLDTAINQAVTDATSAYSLAAILEDPTLATDEAVDALVSNYRVTRRAAAVAAGNVTVVVSTLTPLVVSAGTTFTTDSAVLVVTDTITARTSSGLVVDDTDRLLNAAGDGTYYFSVPVEAQTAGAAGNVTTGTDVTMDPAPTNLVRAYAQDMTGGADAETNDALLTRLLSGAAIRSYGSRSSLQGLLEASMSGVTAVSVVGAGDAEQLRDRHGLIPVSSGGKVDVYVRTATLYQQLVLTVTATLVSKVGSVGTWQFGINRDDAPGFYEIEKILLPDQLLTATGFAPSQDTRGYDLTLDADLPYAPDIVTATEAIYSAYQTAVVQFVDTQTNATALTPGTATAEYQVVVRLLPDLLLAQQTVSARAHRPAGGDILARAPVPVFVRASFNLNVATSAAEPDLAAVREACAAAVNAGGFASKLPASVVSRAALLVVPTAQVTALSLSGRLRPADGSVINLSGTDALTLTEDSETLVSGRTVCYFLDPSAVTVTIVRV
jgi:hypothetical protein